MCLLSLRLTAQCQLEAGTYIYIYTYIDIVNPYKAIYNLYMTIYVTNLHIRKYKVKSAGLQKFLMRNKHNKLNIF